MIQRDELKTYLHELLGCANFDDYSPNGLQIEGKSEIRRICTAVTASLDVIEKAVTMQADALLVHHGYFWRGEIPVITGMKRERIGRLLVHNMNLFAYHLPLDCHPEFGNNASLGHLFNLNSMKMHPAGKNANLLWSGSFSTAKKPDAISALIQEKLCRQPLHIQGSEKPIQNIAWCSGAAQDFIEEAKALGADAYLSGEVSERTYYQAKELGIHYFACGHHATERLGVQALGRYLTVQFNLEHDFIDSSNPI